MVVLDFLCKLFGGGMDLWIVLLSFYEYRLSSGDTQRWLGHSNPAFCNNICSRILHKEAVVMLSPFPIFNLLANYL